MTLLYEKHIIYLANTYHESTHFRHCAIELELKPKVTALPWIGWGWGRRGEVAFKKIPRIKEKNIANIFQIISKQDYLNKYITLQLSCI